VTRHERRGPSAPDAHIHLSNSQLADIRSAKVSASIAPFSEGGGRDGFFLDVLRRLTKIKLRGIFYTFCHSHKGKVDSAQSSGYALGQEMAQVLVFALAVKL